MQPSLAERPTDDDHDGDRLVRQLATVVEQNREAYKEALDEFRTAQAAYFAHNRPNEE